MVKSPGGLFLKWSSIKGISNGHFRGTLGVDSTNSLKGGGQSFSSARGMRRIEGQELQKKKPGSS